MNRKDMLVILQEAGHKLGTSGVKDLLDSYDMEMDDIELGFYVKDHSKVKWKSKSRFVKIFVTEVEKLMNDEIITVETLGFLTLLASYLNYEESSLVNKDGSYLEQSDIVKLTKWSRKKVSNTINLLIELEIMYVQKREDDKRKSVYFINPNLFHKGQKIDKETKEYYDNKKKTSNT